MKPTTFPQHNIIYRHPEDMTPEQVMSISAFVGKIQGGNCDGQEVVVVAWKPESADIERILQGQPVFLLCFGGLPPHSMGTAFEEVIGQG